MFVSAFCLLSCLVLVHCGPLALPRPSPRLSESRLPCICRASTRHLQNICGGEEKVDVNVDVDVDFLSHGNALTRVAHSGKQPIEEMPTAIVT